MATNKDFIVKNGIVVGTDAEITGNITATTFTGVTPTMVGLGNVDNTPDLLKPVSTATQIAIDSRAIEMAIALG